MKIENDFNRFLAVEFKKLSPDVHYLKASDKFTVGVSDFIVWRRGRSAGIESKFIRDWPSDRSLLLKHPFTGAQQTFLESVALTCNSGIGIIGIGSEKRFFVIDYMNIPKSGNWKTEEFKRCGFYSISFDSISDFVEGYV